MSLNLRQDCNVFAEQHIMLSFTAPFAIFNSSTVTELWRVLPQQEFYATTLSVTVTKHKPGTYGSKDWAGRRPGHEVNIAGMITNAVFRSERRCTLFLDSHA